MNLNSSYVSIIKSGHIECNVGNKNKCDGEDLKNNNNDKSVNQMGEVLKQPIHYPKCNFQTTFIKYLNSHINSGHSEKIRNQSDVSQLNNEKKENDSNCHATPPSGKNNFFCDKCDFTTSFKYGFKIHLRNHSFKYKFNCTKCSYKTNVECYFNIHQKNHLGEYSFRCTECEYKTNWKDVFQIHLGSHREEKIFECEDCEFKSNKEEDYEIHQCSRVVAYKFHCVDCDFKTSEEHSFQIHKLSHNLDFIFCCSTCHYKTNDKELFKIHANSHSVESEIDCMEFGYKTKQFDTLHNHNFTRNQVEFKYHCLICDYATNEYNSFKNHSYTPFGKLNCTFCSFRTNDQRHFKFHRCNSLKSSSTFCCSGCNFKTNDKVYFRDHQKKEGHDNVNKFNSETFVDTKAFENKIKIQPTVVKRLFRCEQCDYNTPSQCDLVNHKLIHFNGDLTYHCIVCKKFKTNLRSDLILHESLHTSDSILQCPRCNYKTIEESELIVHEKLHHNCNFNTDLKSRPIKNKEKHNQTCCLPESSFNFNTLKSAVQPQKEFTHLDSQRDPEIDIITDEKAILGTNLKHKVNTSACFHERFDKRKKLLPSNVRDLRSNTQMNVLCHNENSQLDYSESENNRDISTEVKGNYTVMNVWDGETNDLNNLRTYQCDSCNYEANTLYLLILHEALHTDEIMFHCSECIFFNTTRNVLILHQKKYCINRI